MNFEERLREEINMYPFQSSERRLLKVVLGEFQRKAVGKSASDEAGYNVVRKMIKANEENSARLGEDDPRTQVFKEENQVMAMLLPKWWDADEIQAHLDLELIRSAKNDGQAMGLAMRTLKGLDAPVEGDVVKAVVSKIRES